MARDLGIASSTVFAAFPVAVVVCAVVGRWSGRLIDRHGGRPVLMGTPVLFAATLVALGMADSVPALFAAQHVTLQVVRTPFTRPCAVPDNQHWPDMKEADPPGNEHVRSGA